MKSNTKFVRAFVTIALVAMVSSSAMLLRPEKTQADIISGLAGGLLGCSATSALSGLGSSLGGSAGVGGSAVPVTESTVRSNTTQLKTAKCTWDGLFYTAAHETLHALTDSVVDWINNGFEGNPSFMTNPGGFFADVADQVTGAYIANGGMLSALCSPFNLDLRISLGLAVNPYTRTKYACTLSTIIKNAKKSSVSVGVTAGASPNGATIGDLASGDVLNKSSALSVNGQSVNDFYNDFSQGGWDAYMAMTTEPQNNAYGAYMQAQSDIHSQIANRNTNINNDLNRGNGFLSWQKCDDLGTDPDQVDDDDPTITTKVVNGTLSYQRCHTETPGTVISNTLNKQMGATTDELNLANSLNESISAIVSALITKTLSNGLLSMSASYSPSTGGAVSVSNLSNGTTNNTTQTKYIDPATSANFAGIRSQAADEASTYINLVKGSVNNRTQAVTNLNNELAQAQSVRVCIASLSSSSFVANEQVSLDGIISDTSAKLPDLQRKAADAASALAKITDLQNKILATNSATQLMVIYNDSSISLTYDETTAANADSAKTDLDTIDALVKATETNLAPYRSLCQNRGLRVGAF